MVPDPSTRLSFPVPVVVQMASRDTGREVCRGGASPGMPPSASAKEDSLVLSHTTPKVQKPVPGSVVALDGAPTTRISLQGGPTEKAGVKKRHTPIENYAGFLKFGTHHRALQGTQVFRKKPASVRQ